MVEQRDLPILSVCLPEAEVSVQVANEEGSVSSLPVKIGVDSISKESQGFYSS